MEGLRKPRHEIDTLHTICPDEPAAVASIIVHIIYLTFRIDGTAAHW
jgi:hypothetical protein